MGGVCCRFMIGVLAGVPSPFGRLVATRATDGLVECATCRVLYSFHQLDANDAQTLRVFSLAPMIGPGLDELVKAQEILLPRWPRWHLEGKSSAPFAATLDELRADAAPEELIAVAEDLLDELTLWRPVGLGPHHDWLGELGLDRKALRR